MDMRVDESRHQRSAADIEHSCLGGFDGHVRNFTDSPTLDENVLAFRAVLVFAVEDAGVFEQNREHIVTYGEILVPVMIKTQKSAQPSVPGDRPRAAVRHATRLCGGA